MSGIRDDRHYKVMKGLLNEHIETLRRLIEHPEETAEWNSSVIEMRKSVLRSQIKEYTKSLDEYRDEQRREE